MTPLQDVDHNVPPPSSQQHQQLQSSGSVTFLGYDSDVPLILQKPFASKGKAVARDVSVGDSPGKRWRMRQEHGHALAGGATASTSKASSQPHFSSVIDLASDSEDDLPSTSGRQLKAHNLSGTTHAAKHASSDGQDEEEHEKQAKAFANRLGVFAAPVIALPPAPLPHDGLTRSAETRNALKAEVGATSKSKSRAAKKPKKESDDEGKVSAVDLDPNRLPAISEDIIPTLRSIERCPLCYQVEFTNLAKRKRKARKQKKNLELKKAATASGPDRLLHLRQCMVVTEILDLGLVLDLVSDEHDRSDRLRRQAHAELIAKETAWKTITGESPPGTQTQEAALPHRGRRSFLSTLSTSKRKNGKKSPSPTKQVVQKRILGGDRGGLRLATCLVRKPQRFDPQVKKTCGLLFGYEQTLHVKKGDDHLGKNIHTRASLIKEYYDFEAAEEMCRPCAKADGSGHGLRFGSCAQGPSCATEHSRLSASRLHGGHQLGFVLARRFGCSEHDAECEDMAPIDIHR